MFWKSYQVKNALMSVSSEVFSSLVTELQSKWTGLLLR